MRTVLAAVDASAAARPVLETAVRVARLAGAIVDAVHVTEPDDPDDPVALPGAVAAQLGLPLRLLSGGVADSLLGALASRQVVAAVVGARRMPAGRRPAGHTALEIVTVARKPVVVVPPEVGQEAGPLRRLLLPLDGTVTTSRGMTGRLAALVRAEVELVVLHVFTPENLPPVLDRPARDLEVLGREFLARHCQDARRIELRAGVVGHHIGTVCHDQAIDLVVLTWSQDTSAGHAAVVREVLADSHVPVLLLPADTPTALDPEVVGARAAS